MDSINAAVIAAESGEYPTQDVDLTTWLQRADELVERFIHKPFTTLFGEVTE